MPTIAPPEQGYTPLPAGGGATGAGVPPVQIPQTVPGVGPTPPAQPSNQPGPAATPVPTTQVPGAGSTSGGLGKADLRLPTVDELRQLPGQIDTALHDPNLAANVAQTLNDPDLWIEVGAVVVSSVAVGALCVGCAGIACAVIAGAAVGGVVAGGVYAAKQAVHHQEITAGGVANHVALGALGGAVGGAVGFAGGKAFQAITGKLGKQAAGIAENTEHRFSRFVVDSSGETTMFMHSGKEALEVTEHAAQRMTQRGISIDSAESALRQNPFRYFHQNVWKTGYYDSESKLFVGTVNGRVTTMISNAKPKYIDNLQRVIP